jgi:leader peptidase (prepilin peptidase)/N-methyltransferase
MAGVLTLAALLGLVTGTLLDLVIERVPSGVPLRAERRCPGCDVVGRRRGNVPLLGAVASARPCPACGVQAAPHRLGLEVFTAAAFVGVTWLCVAGGTTPGGAMGWTAAALVTIAFLWFAAISIALTVIDIEKRRLPDAIVLPSWIVAGVLFLLAWVAGAPAAALGRAVVGAAALFALYFGLRVIQPGGMGGGDVKLAGVVGAYLGWTGGEALVIGSFAAFVLGGLFGVVLLAGGRAGRRTRIAFGPWMLAGAWLGIVTGM